MRMPSFGRKAPAPDERPGHAAMLRRLKEEDASDPITRLRLAGNVTSDLVYRTILGERGVKIEDYLCILGSVGGFSCIAGVLHTLAAAPRDVGSNELTVAQGTDGNRYYFGDLPNRALLEDRLSLLSLALGTADQLGAPVSIEMVQEAMAHVAGTVGGYEFGIPRLPPAHMPGDLPIKFVRHFWPKVSEAMNLYEVPVAQRTTAFGFAIQHALALGKDALDPVLAIRIVVECACPMAKVDPKRLF